MTDWFGARTPWPDERGQRAADAGHRPQRRELLAALESGALKEEVLDRNVERVLALVLRTPTFHHATHTDRPDLKAHAEEAHQAAAEGMVLLRNQGALPLKTPAKVALFGNSAYATIIGGTGSGDVNGLRRLPGPGSEGRGRPWTRRGRNLSRYIKEAEAKRPPMPMPFMLPPPIAEMTVGADEIARLARDTDLALVSIRPQLGRVPRPDAGGRGLPPLAGGPLRAESSEVVHQRPVAELARVAADRHQGKIRVAGQPRDLVRAHRHLRDGRRQHEGHGHRRPLGLRFLDVARIGFGSAASTDRPASFRPWARETA